MGKHEKGTPKEIANRVKSKGLQKLKWFCQMCSKQCRDENGFKCHLTSESHQRQLLLFAENSGSYLRQFSNDFEKNFMLLLRTQYGTKRVRANEVYNDFIKDKGHVHMNSTTWHTLTGFVQYLGNSGKCKIDQGEKGWYIQYIDQEAVMRKEEEERKQKQEKDDEERQMQMMEERVIRGLEYDNGEEYKPTDLIRNDDEKITLSLAVNKKPTPEELAKATISSVSVFDKLKKEKVKKEEPESDGEDDRERRKRDHRHRDERRRDERRRSRSRSREERHKDHRDRGGERRNRRDEPPKSKKSALDEIKEMEERKKEKKNRKDYWLHEGIVVKVITKSLGADYYKAKAVVKKLCDEYTANVKFDDRIVVKLDQAHCETVIPAIGRPMLVVNGAYRGSECILDNIDEKNFALKLTISSGLLKGRQIDVAYEDASKLA